MPRFFSVEYSSGGRTYTHAVDDDAMLVYPGDVVEAETRRGPTRAVIVAQVAEPAFPCKPILRVLETAADRALRKAAAALDPEVAAE